MDLSERELLIKIEQQLKSLSESHREVLSEISVLFDKQDRDSKLLAVLTSEFKNHLDAAKAHRDDAGKRCVSHRDDLVKRILRSENHIEKLFAELESARLGIVNAKSEVSTTANRNTARIETVYNELGAEIANSSGELSAEVNTLLTAETQDRLTFQTTLKTYVKSSKIFITLVAFLITLLTSIVYPLILALFKHWLVKIPN
jgi:hypothetical protein